MSDLSIVFGFIVVGFLFAESSSDWLPALGTDVLSAESSAKISSFLSSEQFFGGRHDLIRFEAELFLKFFEGC